MFNQYRKEFSELVYNDEEVGEKGFVYLIMLLAALEWHLMMSLFQPFYPERIKTAKELARPNSIFWVVSYNFWKGVFSK